MPSEIIDWARWLGLCAIATTILLLLYILLVRGWQGVLEYRRQRLLLRWRPLCMEATCGLPLSESPMYLSNSEWLAFFRLWHHYLLHVKGEARDNLRCLGRRMGLHHIALKRLTRASNDRELIAAIVASGLLHDIRAWEPLLNYLYNANPVLSFASARSLTRIDPRVALNEVIPLMAKRDDWSRHLIAGLLMEAGPERVSAPLLAAILNTPKEQTVTLVRFLRFADVNTSNTVLFHFMPTTQDTELLSACLKAARSPRVLPLVRERLQDNNWTVRLEAANTLSRLGTVEDIDNLLLLLSDPQWWVRYRAAQAIGELLHRDKDKMTRISRQQNDRYAADMLAQVVAEWEQS